MPERINVVRIAACIAAIFVCCAMGAIGTGSLAHVEKQDEPGNLSPRHLSRYMEKQGEPGDLSPWHMSPWHTMILDRGVSGRNEGNGVSLPAVIASLMAAVRIIFGIYGRIVLSGWMVKKFTLYSYIHNKDGKKRQVFIDRSK